MGGRKPTVPSAMLEQWRTHYMRRRGEGSTLWQIATELAKGSGYCAQTVYLYLDQDARRRRRQSNLASYPRRSAKAVARRTYLRNYFRVHRHPERYLPQAFVAQPEAPLETIADRLAELCEGVRYRPCTIERVLRHYQAAQQEGRLQGEPLEEIAPGRWRYGSRPEAQKPLLLLVPFPALLLLVMAALCTPTTPRPPRASG